LSGLLSYLKRKKEYANVVFLSRILIGYIHPLFRGENGKILPFSSTISMSDYAAKVIGV